MLSLISPFCERDLARRGITTSKNMSGNRYGETKIELCARRDIPAIWETIVDVIKYPWQVSSLVAQPSPLWEFKNVLKAAERFKLLHYKKIACIMLASFKGNWIFEGTCAWYFRNEMFWNGEQKPDEKKGRERKIMQSRFNGAFDGTCDRSRQK